MDTRTFRKQMVGMTLTVTPTGEVTDGIFAYGRLTRRGFVPVRGGLVDPSYVDHMEFDYRSRIVTLVTVDGARVDVAGGRFCDTYPESQAVYVPDLRTDGSPSPGSVDDDDGEDMGFGLDPVSDPEDLVPSPAPAEPSEFRITEPDPPSAPVVEWHSPAPTSESALFDLMPTLYPELEGKLYYDVMAEREMVDLSLFDGFGNGSGIVPIEDHHLTMFHIDLQRRLRENGFDCRKLPSSQTMNDVFSLMANLDRRNAFRDWMESHEWDGRPRIGTLFADYFGGTAPSLPTEEDEALYLGAVAEAWLLGAVARAYHKTQHDVVPVFISTEHGNGKGQGIGKGRLLRMLSGCDDWYRTVNADVREEAKFLDAARGGLIVELSESTQLRTNNNDSLKYFISKDADFFRKSYGRYSGEYPRHFILAATSNHERNFTDLTGSRRFYPVICDASKVSRDHAYIPVHGRPRTTQYEVEQIWAEALHLYREGHRPYVSGRADELAAIMQDAGVIENPGVALIDNYLDNPEGVYSEVGARVCREIIFRDVFYCTTLPSQDMERAYRAWRDGTKCWKSKQYRDPEVGRMVRGFVRIAKPGDISKRGIKLNLVDAQVYEREIEPAILAEMDEETRRRVLGIPDDLYLEEDEPILPDHPADPIPEAPSELARGMGGTSCATLMSNLVSVGGQTRPDQALDVSMLDEEDVRALLDEGWIYDLGTDTHECYINRMP